jgi:hypothetical protein
MADATSETSCRPRERVFHPLSPLPRWSYKQGSVVLGVQPLGVNGRPDPVAAESAQKNDSRTILGRYPPAEKPKVVGRRSIHDQQITKELREGHIFSTFVKY